MKKYKVGLIIGRFQPLHKGHLYLIKEGLKFAQKLIIAIGSINVSNEDNPYTFSERYTMVEDILKKEKLEDKIIKIIGIEDNPSDDVWFDQVIKNTGKIDVVFGNNEWVQGIFEEKGMKVLSFPFFKRHIYEGRKIRLKMQKSNYKRKTLPKH